MTEGTDRSDAHIALSDFITSALRQAAKLPPGAVITHCVTVVQTVEYEDGEPHWDIHRIHPFGALDPSAERGVLRDAIDDSLAQRRWWRRRRNNNN